MIQDVSLRRRIALAAVITAVLVPASYLLWAPDDRANSGGQADVSTAATDYGEPDVMGTVPVGYLGGEEGDDDDGDAPVIAIPRAPESVKVYATYSRTVGRVRDCLVPFAPFNAELTITNTDTGRRAACDNVIDPNDYADRYDPEEAILHIDTYLALADLADAPVPIEVTW